MAVSHHLKHYVLHMPKTEAAMPPRICKYHIRLSSVIIKCDFRLVNMDAGSPCISVNQKFEGIEIAVHLQMEGFRNSVAPPEKIYCMCTGYLIDISHYHQIALFYSCILQHSIHGGSLKPLQHERILSFPQFSTCDFLINYSRLCEGKPVRILGEKQGLSLAGEGGIGFDENKVGDDRQQLMPSNLEEVELVIEDDSIEDTSGRFSDGPTMEQAEGSHGEMGGEVVNDELER